MPVTTLVSASRISGYAGETASFIAKRREESVQNLEKTNVLAFPLKKAIQQLLDTAKECSFAGWDGESAKPITIDTLYYTILLLKSLAFGIEPPEVGAEPDGAVTLEWYRSPDRIISISIDSRGWLHYAAMIGASKRHGTDFAFFGISEDLLKLIAQVTRQDTHK